MHLLNRTTISEEEKCENVICIASILSGIKVVDLRWFAILLHGSVLTFKKAPASKHEEGDEPVREVVHGGDHHAWGA